jgi:diguanylate cyclase
MSDPEDIKRSQDIAETAISQIRANKSPAWPSFYEIWFNYAAGFNPALNKAINEVIRNKGEITAHELEMLRHEHFASDRLERHIEHVGTEVSGKISELLNLITSASGQTSEYNTTLKDATNNLSKAADGDAVKAIVENLITMTHGVEKSNQELSSQLQESRKQIEYLQENLEAVRAETFTDQLTTLSNRKQFDKSMDIYMRIAEETNSPFSLLMTDIDHFKKFNDTHGHQTGDQVLRLVAMAVKQNVKGQDVACRYGGEEFAIILPNTDIEQATAVAEHIRKAVMGKELVKRSTGANLGRVTTSVGVAMWRPGDTAHSVIERADQCLYAAKRAGRNCVKHENDPDVDLEEVA